MIHKGLAFLSLFAVASNAVAHLLQLTGLASLSLSVTWPLHLLAVVMFLAMCFSLCSGSFVLGQQLSRLSQEELSAYAQNVEQTHREQSPWQCMFGRTPLWVGAVAVLLFVYTIGSFVVTGFQNAVEVRERYDQPWLYNEDDGWIRPATEADLIQLQQTGLCFVTIGSALMAFVPWAYFTYRSLPDVTGNLSDAERTG